MKFGESPKRAGTVSGKPSFGDLTEDVGIPLLLLWNGHGSPWDCCGRFAFQEGNLLWKIGKSGRSAIICSFKIKNARCFPATPACRRSPSTACFATVRCMPWARPAGAALPIRRVVSKIAPAVHFPTSGKTMMPCWPGFRSWQSWPAGTVEPIYLMEE